MSIKPFKFIVTAVCLQMNGDNEIIGEAEAQPVTLYCVDALVKWASEFEGSLEGATVTDRPQEQAQQPS
jgi:hypothetical protein